MQCSPNIYMQIHSNCSSNEKVLFYQVLLHPNSSKEIFSDNHPLAGKNCEHLHSCLCDFWQCLDYCGIAKHEPVYHHDQPVQSPENIPLLYGVVPHESEFL